MDAESNLVTEEREGGTTDPNSRPARRYRFRLGTMIVLVGAAAPAIALYSRIFEFFGLVDRDAPALTLLAIVLTGIAVGAWRRATPRQVLAQIGLTCAALLARFEVSYTRLTNYWLALVVAVTIVLPLLARGHPGATPGCSPGRKRVAWASAMLLNVALNLTALAIFCTVHNTINRFVIYNGGSVSGGLFNGDLIIDSSPFIASSRIASSLQTQAEAGLFSLVPVPAPAPAITPALPAPMPVAGPSPAAPQPIDANKASQEDLP